MDHSGQHQAPPGDQQIAAALAWIDAWYATPDEKPPGYSEAFLAEIAAGRATALPRLPDWSAH